MLAPLAVCVVCLCTAVTVSSADDAGVHYLKSSTNSNETEVTSDKSSPANSTGSFEDVGRAQRTAELKLIKEMLDPEKYNKACTPSIPVNVSMSLSPHQVTNLDERYQILHSNLWFTFKWIDPHFIWDPEKYAGVLEIFLQPSQIWIPDIVIYNSVSEDFLGTKVFSETPLTVRHNGSVRWMTLSVMRTSCKVQVRYFPFDTQACNITLASWNRDQQFLDLNASDSGIGGYVENGEWELVRLETENYHKHYPCCAIPFTMANYTLKLRRKPIFFIFNYVIPCILLISVGISAFFLPPESGDKTNLTVTLLLTMTVFQVMVSDKLPRTSEIIPLLTQFLGSSVIILSLVTITTILSAKMFMSGERGKVLPEWLRSMCQSCLPKMLCFSSSTRREINRLMGEENHEHSSAPPIPGGDDVKLISDNKVLFENQWDTKRITTDSSNLSPSVDNITMQQLLMRVTQIQEGMSHKTSVKETRRGHLHQWRMATIVMERLMLIVFASLTFLVCLGIFIQAMTSQLSAFTSD